MAAERAAGGGGEFEIDLGAGGERAEGGFVEGLLGEVGVEERRVDVERGEADAGDGERVAFAEAVGEAGGFDGETADAAVSLRLTMVPVCSMMPVNMDLF